MLRIANVESAFNMSLHIMFLLDQDVANRAVNAIGFHK